MYEYQQQPIGTEGADTGQVAFDLAMDMRRLLRSRGEMPGTTPPLCDHCGTWAATHIIADRFLACDKPRCQDALKQEARGRPLSAETIILILPGDYSVRLAGDEYELGAYVRCCDRGRRELVYWSAEVFEREPERAMGAFLAILVDSTLLERYRQQGSSAFILPDVPGPGDEELVVWKLTERYALCSGGEAYGLGAYVLFRDLESLDDKEDGEVVYWDKLEWQEQPEEVLGAILACLQDPLLLVRHRVRKRNDLL